MHPWMTRTEREVSVDFLESFESCVKDGERSFNDGTFLESINVSCMNNIDSLTVFRTWSITRNTFSSIVVLFVGRTWSDTGSIILQQVIRTLFDTSCSIGILSLRIHFPRVGGRVVLHHWRTFLLANTIIMKVTTGKTITLLGSCTASCTKQVTTFSWIRTKASSLMTLRRAVCLGEFLAVVWSFTPTAFLTRVIAWRTCLGERERNKTGR